MKKIYSIIAALALTINVFAQAPEKMSYQAVIRDAGNTLVASKSVGMQISILQGSVSGTAVYVETQTPTTNINGLVSLEIGSGTVVSGTFNTIDWSTGIYFVKTESDPTGGTTYTVTATNQLMTVPYALYAKTSGSGPVGPVGPAGNDGPQGPTGPQGPQGLAGGSLPSGGSEGQVLTMVNGVPTWVAPQTTTVATCSDGIMNQDETEVDCGGATCSPCAPAKIGDLRYGGIVFWVDPDDNTDGLVCSLSDLHTKSTWTDAVSLAKSFRGGGYTDWYLPSMNELNIMWWNLADSDGNFVNIGPTDPNNLGGFSRFPYWSSSEYSSFNAWLQDFYLGNQDFNVKTYPAYVRAVRAF